MFKDNKDLYWVARENRSDALWLAAKRPHEFRLVDGDEHNELTDRPDVTPYGEADFAKVCEEQHRLNLDLWEDD